MNLTSGTLHFDSQPFTVTTTGSGTLRLFQEKEEDKRKPHEKFFGMSEDEIYKNYGLYFIEKEISINGEKQYEIGSDLEAEIDLIKNGFIVYKKGKKIWNHKALNEGWINGWTPKNKVRIHRPKGHVYFVKSKNFHKIGSSSAAQIQRRIKYQKPMEILAVSPKIEDYRKLEKELHHHFADKRVLKYEVFENLTEEDIKYIMNKLGNKIHVKI